MKSINLQSILYGFIISFLLIGNSSIAQEFKAGIQFGMTGTQVTGDALSGFSKAGLFGGFTVKREIGSLGEAQLEINFIQKGSRKNAQPDKGIYTSYLMRLNYIEVPVFYRFKITRAIGIEAGAQFAYLISFLEKDEQGPLLQITDFNKYDISAFAGINYHINDKWSISLRYSYSVRSFRPKPNNPTGYLYYDGGQYNEVLCTALQFSF